jgi:hypothetical protein
MDVGFAKQIKSLAKTSQEILMLALYRQKYLRKPAN